MEQFFTKDYTGEPFVLFGTAHLVALAIIVLVNLSLILIRRNPSQKLRTILRYSIGIELVVVETSWHLWNYFTGQWTIQTMLPLHLCSMFVWLSAYMMFTRNTKIYPIAYLLGIGGATQALLTPDAGIYGFPHFRFWQVMLSHGGIVLAAMYMTLMENKRPYFKDIGRIFLYGNGAMIIIGLINWALGSNYMFIAHKPETASVIDLFPPWPWYIIFIELMGLAVSLILYAPFGIGDLIRKLRKKPAAS
jgi:hypothetical integral membrane protein (TIGR02206 family)